MGERSGRGEWVVVGAAGGVGDEPCPSPELQALSRISSAKTRRKPMCLALAAYENRMASLLETANQLVVVDLPPIDSKPKKIVAVIDHTLPYLMQLLHRNNVTVVC